MIVPAATFDAAVKEAELPAGAAVLKVKMALPAVQVVDDVEGVTVASTQVVTAPV
jgi:hypothetical protein